MIVTRWFLESKDGEFIDGPYRTKTGALLEVPYWVKLHADPVLVQREIDVIDPLPREDRFCDIFA
jgi:hypothetical protein